MAVGSGLGSVGGWGVRSRRVGRRWWCLWVHLGGGKVFIGLKGLVLEVFISPHTCIIFLSCHAIFSRLCLPSFEFSCFLLFLCEFYFLFLFQLLWSS